MSLSTVELRPDPAGTKTVYTEQAVFLDGFDDGGSRERGTQALFDRMDALLRGAPVDGGGARRLAARAWIALAFARTRFEGPGCRPGEATWRRRDRSSTTPTPRRRTCGAATRR